MIPAIQSCHMHDVDVLCVTATWEKVPQSTDSKEQTVNIVEVSLPQMSLHFYLAFKPLANCTRISTQMNLKLFEPPASCCLALPRFEGSFMILIFLIRRIPWL